MTDTGANAAARGYEPLDISALCDAESSLLGADFSPRTGRQVLRGLPFLVGSADAEGPAYITLGPGTPNPRSLRIPIARTAQRIIVAHSLLDTGMFDGEEVGTPVAEYIFHYSDGESQAVAVRERCEIAAVAWDHASDYPLSWGQLPIYAAPSEQDSLVARYEGPWGDVGLRQSGVELNWQDSVVYLWPWLNPRPEVPVEYLEIVPRDKRLLVAGITVGQLEEDPFAYGPPAHVLVELTRDDDAERPFALDVAVDRGVAGYAYALPRDTIEAFMAAPFPGWGEAPNLGSSPAYVAVAAAPSATLTVALDGEQLASASWGELCATGELAPDPRVRLRLVAPDRTWVRTTIVDDATGEPIPCRIHFRSPEGIPYAPHGHHAHINSELGSFHLDIGGDLKLGQATYAYVDGTCEGWLPVGDVIVDVARGFEHRPLRTRLRIEPGQRELTLRLERFADLRGDGWVAADTHTHFLSTRGAHLEADGEGVAIANLLLSQWGDLFTSTEEFTGVPDVAASGRTIVFAGQENRQRFLGHLSLLGLSEPVMPWCSDGPEEAEIGGQLETTLSQWADAARTHGALVVLPHFPQPVCEVATLIATGRADAIEMIAHHPWCHEEYYRYLNCGYRLPLVAGTDKMTSDVPLGLMRTYARLAEGAALSWDAWVAAVRRGETFVSSGPLLALRVDGRPVGTMLEVPAGARVEVEASAQSIFPIHALQLVMGGTVVATTDEAAGAESLSLSTALTIESDTWIAARAAGPGYESVKHHDSWRRGVMAHTSPVYVDCGGSGYAPFDPGAARYALSLIDAGLQYVRERTRPAGPGPRRIAYPHGEADHRAALERPFHEARRALLERANGRI